jgi:hypothetical protein
VSTYFWASCDSKDTKLYLFDQAFGGMDRKPDDRSLRMGTASPLSGSAIGMARMVKFSSGGFDQWAFAISRHRRVPHGKTDTPNA